MAVAYRLMEPNELEQALDLWLAVYPGTERERWRRELLSIPGSAAHTYVAVENGGVLSTVLVWVREMNDAAGIARRTGNVSHVATHPEARRRGHARRLLGMAVDEMKSEGCELSTLFTSDEARPLYEGLGWETCPLPVWQGMLRKVSLPESGEYSVRAAQPSEGPKLWETLGQIYAEFNQGRPLAIQRDPWTWQGFTAYKVTDWIESGASLWLAHLNGSPEAICGYLIAHGGEQGFLVAEAGVRNGHAGALSDLLGQVLRAHTDRLPVGARLYLPNEPGITTLLQTCFDPLQQMMTEDMLARPLHPGGSSAALRLSPARGSGTFWLLDQI